MTTRKFTILRIGVTGFFLGLFVIGWFVIASRDANKIKANIQADALKNSSTSDVSQSDNLNNNQTLNTSAIGTAKSSETLNASQSNTTKNISSANTEQSEIVQDEIKPAIQSDNNNKYDPIARHLKGAISNTDQTVPEIGAQDRNLTDSLLLQTDSTHIGISITDPDQPEVNTTTT